MRHYKRKDSWTWRHSNRDCSKWAQSKGPEHMVPSMSELWLICAWPQPPEKRDEEAKQNIWRNNGENVFKFNENYKPINLRRLTNPRNEGLDVKKGENWFLVSHSSKTPVRMKSTSGVRAPLKVPFPAMNLVTVPADSNPSDSLLYPKVQGKEAGPPFHQNHSKHSLRDPQERAG